MILIRIIFLFLLNVLSYYLCAQNTIGVTVNTEQTYEGYTLISSISDNNVYLIDNCGRVVHEWELECDRGVAAYIDKDGNLYKSCRTPGFANTGGVTGAIQKLSWDGNLKWNFHLANTQYHLHHDFDILPNGNILVLAYEKIELGDWRNLGSTIAGNIDFIQSEAILEIRQEGLDSFEIVWEWHLTDHFVQDLSPEYPNFAAVNVEKRKLDINSSSTGPAADRIHFNSIRYNEALEQIIVSAKHLNEVFIIEKTDNSEIASKGEGGKYGFGGDFLYRFGNGENYGLIDTSRLAIGEQHNIQWVPNSNTNITIFNNSTDSSRIRSEALEVLLPVTDGRYRIDENENFEDISVIWSLDELSGSAFKSRIMSGVQRLSNDNYLIGVADEKSLTEVDIDGNIVWKYIVPIRNGEPMQQGDNQALAATIFNANKYSPLYQGFEGRDLKPSDPIELNFDITECLAVSTSDAGEAEVLEVEINNGMLYITNQDNELQLNVLTATGSEVIDMQLPYGVNEINLTNLHRGLYFISVSNKKTVKSYKYLKH